LQKPILWRYYISVRLALRTQTPTPPADRDKPVGARTRIEMQVRIIWQGKGFYKAVAEAKRLGGSYDPESKTWTVIGA